ncbi:MAG: hypothetical protein ABGX78_06920 [Microbacterium sp.]|uniref:hypothetical protein n=1 Tax=Microbacterium sp. TaxID=51671 RepID=UPI003242AB4F
MSFNSARLLLAFFEGSWQDRNRHNIEPLVAAIADIRSHLRVWQAQGHDVKAFEEAIPNWYAGLLYNIDPSNGKIQGKSERLHTGDLGVLRWAAGLLDSDTASLSEEDRDKLREMVAATRTTLRGDSSLPNDLAMHIATLLLHVEEVLDKYDIVGDFAVEEAVERLLGALRFAETATESKPNVWSKFYSDWLQPVTTAMLGSSPSTALALGQLLGGA